MSKKEIKGVILWRETKTFSLTGEPLSRKGRRALEGLVKKGWTCIHDEELGPLTLEETEAVAGEEWDGTITVNVFMEGELTEELMEEMQRSFEEELKLEFTTRRH